VPEVVFAKRHRGELGVGTNRPCRNQLTDTRLPRLVDQLNPHHRILVEEATWVGAVGANAANVRVEMNDKVRESIRQETTDYVNINEVEGPATGYKDLRRTSHPERLDHDATQNLSAACLDGARIRPIHALFYRIQ